MEQNKNLKRRRTSSWRGEVCLFCSIRSRDTSTRKRGRERATPQGYRCSSTGCRRYLRRLTRRHRGALLRRGLGQRRQLKVPHLMSLYRRSGSRKNHSKPAQKAPGMHHINATYGTESYMYPFVNMLYL